MIKDSNQVKFYFDEDDAKYPSCYKLLIDFDKREVTTNCGDFYYDYSIGFDDIIKVAEYIKSKETHGQHQTRHNHSTTKENS